MTDSVEKTPAFPQAPDWLKTSWSGMSLRDYFAAHAMQGLLCDPHTSWKAPSQGSLATRAYTIADAMLEAREK